MRALLGLGVPGLLVAAVCMCSTMRNDMGGDTQPCLDPSSRIALRSENEGQAISRGDVQRALEVFGSLLPTQDTRPVERARVQPIVGIVNAITRHDGAVRAVPDLEARRAILSAQVVCVADLHSSALAVNAFARIVSRFVEHRGAQNGSVAAFVEAIPAQRKGELQSSLRRPESAAAESLLSLMRSSWPWTVAAYVPLLRFLHSSGVATEPCGLLVPEALPPSDTPDWLRRPLAWASDEATERGFDRVNERVVGGVTRWVEGPNRRGNRAFVLIGLMHLLGEGANVVPRLRRQGIRVVVLLPFVPDIERALIDSGVARQGWVQLASNVYRPPPPHGDAIVRAGEARSDMKEHWANVRPRRAWSLEHAR